MGWPSSLLKSVEGRFYRAVAADHVDRVLAAPSAQSAGRYHRPGQPALYVSREADWAVIAVSRYMAEDGIARVVLPLRLSAARVVDQRDVQHCAGLGIDPQLSATRWQIALVEHRDPPSWTNADKARELGADGIIDPSRGIVGGWYMALFRWNAPGAPRIEVDGDPIPADYPAARSRWPSPPGWMEAAGDLTY